jgi:hypothetical protein
MLIDLDQSTLAYMTAALESVCKKIPPEKDSAELRKKIADELIACTKTYRRSFADFEEAGMRALNEVVRPARMGRLLKYLQGGTAADAPE